MDVAQIVKSTQEQGFASWVDYLNQLRLNELLAKLAAQDINLEQALAELQKMKINVAALIASNRGGGKGMHGFLAEAAETGIENARNLVKGLDAACKWINDNGPADLLRDGVEIQQKFVRAGGHFGLEAVKEHLEKYPDFIKNGGKYQLPKDFYQGLKRLLAMSQEEAAKESASTYRLWKWVQEFFAEFHQIIWNRQCWTTLRPKRGRLIRQLKARSKTSAMRINAAGMQPMKPASPH